MMNMASGIIASAATLERAKAADRQAMLDEEFARDNERVQIQGLANERDEIATIAQMQRRSIDIERMRSEAEAATALGEDGTAGTSADLLLQSVGFQAGTAAVGVDIDAGHALRDNAYHELVVRTDASHAVTNARRSRPDRVGTIFAMGANGFSAFMGGSSNSFGDSGANAEAAQNAGVDRIGQQSSLNNFRESQRSKSFNFSVGVGSGANQGKATSVQNQQLNPRGGV
jgi:hypothetical protein